MEEYEIFIEKIKKELPEWFEAMGEDYFKEVYNNQMRVLDDCKRVKKVFAATQLDQKIADLSNVEVDDTKRLIDVAHLFGNTLITIISNDYDEIYVCPEVAAFMKLSPYFSQPSQINPSGVYKFGLFGTETFKIDCYKVPNEVAEKDCLLLHKRNDEWLKLEVKISEFCERKNNAVREKAKSTYYLR